MKKLINGIDILICLATAAAVIAMYIWGLQEIPLGPYTVPLVKAGWTIFWVYAAFEIMSTVVGQDSPSEFWVGFIATWSVFFAATAAGIYLSDGIIGAYKDVTKILDLPASLLLLGAIWLFSLVYGVLGEGHKLASLKEHARVMRTVVPPAPVATPMAAAPAVAAAGAAAPAATAPAATSGGTPWVALIIGFILMAAFLYVYLNRDSFKAALGDGTAVVTCDMSSKFVRQTTRGVELEVTRTCS